jgi:hypothetical protein
MSKVKNEDVTQIIKDVKKLMNTHDKIIKTPGEVYHEYVEKMLSVGFIYSSFCEVVLCNQFVTCNDKVMRYDPYSVLMKKLSVKNLYNVTSRLLGLLYEPNTRNIEKYVDNNSNVPKNSNSILEKLWMES